MKIHLLQHNFSFAILLLIAFNVHAARITVSDVSGLQNAMAQAVAGDTILVAPGIYVGNASTSGDPGNLPTGIGLFWIGNNGTADHPIVVAAEDPAQKPVLEGVNINDDYVVHITGDYVVLKNLIITFAGKGVVFDNANHGVLEDCEIHNSGAELVHIRDGSSNVTISRNKIYNSGNGGRGSIGEGLYVGTDQARWGADDVDSSLWGDKARTEGYGGYDWRVHGTQVLCNYFSGSISAELMDIKEGTQNTTVTNNMLVGDSVGKKAGAASYDDSFIDQKGITGSFYDNKFCNCGNTLDRFINEVTRAAYDPVPDSLTTDGHSRPWCDTGDADGNDCLEENNEIVESPVDVRNECDEVFPLSLESNVGTLINSASVIVQILSATPRGIELSLQADPTLKMLATLYDSRGIEVSTNTMVNQNQLKILPVSAWSPGVYHLVVKTTNGFIQKRLVLN